MIYQLTRHKWELTEQEVLNELGYNLTGYLGDVNQVPFFLREISTDVYNYAYRKGSRINIPIVEYNLALNAIYLEDLKDAMLAQVRYALRSRGGHMIKDQTGVDFEANIMLDRAIFDRTIAIETEFYMNATGLVKQVPLSNNIPSDLVRGVDY